jgi:hypothetical protein
VRKTDADNATTSTTLQVASELNIPLAANVTYSFEYYVLFTTAGTNTGIGLGVNGPAASTISYTVDIPTTTEGTAGSFSGVGTGWNDAVTATTAPATGSTYLARVHGIVRTTAAGDLSIGFRRGGANAQVVVKQYSWGAVYPS